MKALSLTQPWATLVAIGAKTLETRSWSTPFRGPLAIHATREKPCWSDDPATRAAIDEALARAGYETSEGFKHGCSLLLPRSSIVATCQLHDVVLATEAAARITAGAFARDELFFGDFSLGRHAWLLVDVVKLDRPIATPGRQGLWNFPWPVERVA